MNRQRLAWAATLLVVAAAAAAPAAAPRNGDAGAEPVTVQIVAQVPDKLWNVVSPLMRSLFAREQHQDITFAGKRYALFWSNVQTGHSGSTSDEALAAARRARDQSAFIDRPLTAAEARDFATVPIWLDADALVVRPDNPACQKGLSTAAVRGVLSGRSRTWSALGLPASATGGNAIHLIVSSLVDKPYLSLQPFGVKRSPTARLDPGTHAIAAAADPLALVAMPWSAARPYIDAGTACAVPVAGVAPSVATIRDGSYPGSYTVFWAYPRQPWQVAADRPNPWQARINALFRSHLKTRARPLVLKSAGEYGPRLLP